MMLIKPNSFNISPQRGLVAKETLIDTGFMLMSHFF